MERGGKVPLKCIILVIGAVLIFFAASSLIFGGVILHQRHVAADTRIAPFTLPLPVLRTREDMMSEICTRQPIRYAAEIGVQRAFFAVEILSRCPGLRSYTGVDLWMAQENYDDGSNKDNTTQNEIYRDAQNRLLPFGERARLWRMDSVAGAAQMVDKSLDFVYLDARHDYRSVQDDILAWAPKVRPGGILAGHDYLDASEIDGAWTLYKDGSQSHANKAVRSAVTEYADLTGRQVVVTYGDLWQNKPFPSWFMRM